MRKVYVEVTAKFDPEGNILPTHILWEDGRCFAVDRVLDVRPAVSLKAGGAGVRYICRVKGVETCLFLEENRWFVEGKGVGGK